MTLDQPWPAPRSGGVAFGDALEMGETAAGRFAGLFMDTHSKAATPLPYLNASTGVRHGEGITLQNIAGRVGTTVW